MRLHFSILSALVLAMAVATTALAAPASSSSSSSDGTALAKRDALTRARGPNYDTVRLSSVGATPAYAKPVTFNINGASLFAWQSKTPHNEADAESVFIILHGILRNADSYWSILNGVWARARDAKMGSAVPNSIRLSPQMFSTINDRGAYNSSSIAFGDPNAWAGGDGSTNPAGSNLSIFTIYDALLTKYADKRAYPKMKTITFMGHGGGAQTVQRYAVLGRDNPDPSRLAVRYVIGDPSTMLYFTQDRPVEVDTQACNYFNDFRYGFSRYEAPYALAGTPVSLFKRYMGRDVRYVVGLQDTNDAGDQTCGGKAAGGNFRKDRTLSYWKYINVLAGGKPSNYDKYPGTFPALDARQKANAKIPTSSAATLAAFRGVTVRHKLFTVADSGHSASGVFGSPEGARAIFLPANQI